MSFNLTQHHQLTTRCLDTKMAPVCLSACRLFRELLPVCLLCLSLLILLLCEPSVAFHTYDRQSLLHIKNCFEQYTSGNPAAGFRHHPTCQWNAFPGSLAALCATRNDAEVSESRSRPGPVSLSHSHGQVHAVAIYHTQGRLIFPCHGDPWIRTTPAIYPLSHCFPRNLSSPSERDPAYAVVE